MALPIWLVLTALCIALPVALACYYYLADMSSLKPAGQDLGLPEMEISEMYIYPIKSLRAIKVDSATATPHGFAHDRTFVLLEKTPNATPDYKIIAVSTHPQTTQFEQQISPDGTTLTVRYLAYGNTSQQSSLEMPLAPSTATLEPCSVTMHGSPTAAYRMPRATRAWFTARLGFAVDVVYLGPHRRTPRFRDLSRARFFFFSSTAPLSAHSLTFADCAPYLLCTTASLAAVSTRLAHPMDVRKFRPNVVVDGAPAPWAEDYWAAVRVCSRAQGKQDVVDMVLPHNCVRCTSVNLDYQTGKPASGAAGEVLKRLQADRRVDAGARWSPVFGRYAFWTSRKRRGGGDDEVVWRVGDKVRVTRVNRERTVWNWPDLG